MKRIPLTNNVTGVMVDDEDYPVLSRLTWYMSDSGYAITDTPVKHIKMHKLLIGAIPPKTVIDHIDRDKLNNQKENLRVVSHRKNANNSNRVIYAKHYHYNTRRKHWIVDSKVLGVRYIRVDNPEIAERVVKRMMLGFPKDIAVREANNPTISITNWQDDKITYDVYCGAKASGKTIKNYRRKLARASK